MDINTAQGMRGEGDGGGGGGGGGGQGGGGGRGRCYEPDIPHSLFIRVDSP